MPESVKVMVPATTANLGPGFDILGAALNLYNYIEIKPANEGRIVISGSEPGNELAVDKTNLVFKSAGRIFQELGTEMPELEINIEINIPLSRGLGSSSSAIVGGLVAANIFTGNKLSNEALLNIANDIEGHPDNVAPCLLGGIIASLCKGKKVFTHKITTNLDLSFIVLIPDFQLSTEKARKVLPSEVPFHDAVFNASHLGFLINALISGNPEMLGISLDDRLHEQYRGKLIPGFEQVKKRAVASGAIGSVLSGAGPTILALAKENEIKIAEAMQNKWQEYGVNAAYKILKLDTLGTRAV